MTVDPKETNGTVAEKGETETPEAEEEEVVFLSNLAILPPLQKNEIENESLQQDSIVLPPIRPEEPVQSIRAALSEVVGYAQMTNYRLEFTPGKELVKKSESKKTSTVNGVVTTTDSSSNKKKNKKKKSNKVNSNGKSSSSSATIVSKFTGPNAVVRLSSNKIPKSTLESNDAQVLDDYGDLTTLQNLTSNSCFQIILERYDVATLREHVRRTRNLLEDGNVPHVTSLLSEENDVTNDKSTKATQSDSSSDESPKHDNKDETNQQSEKSSENKVAKKEKTEKEIVEEEQKKRRELAEKLPQLELDQPVKVDGSNLADFFYLSCGEEDAMDAFHTKNGKSPLLDMTTRLNEVEKITKTACKITYSGFNPPPSNRKILGDLAYLEITPPKYPNEAVFFVTCIPNGFYVNNTISNEKFDPTPSSKDPCFSHSLLDCLLQRSKSIRNSWMEALSAAKERAELNSPPSLPNDNPLQALFRLAVRGDMTSSNHKELQISSTSTCASLDTVLLRPSWLVPLPRTQKGEKLDYIYDYNCTRADTDLNDTFGLDIYGGSQRDWNEEIQSAREMPTNSLQQRIERAKVLHKVFSDFGEAALAGAMAVIDGNIIPMNPNEPLRSHVYVYNNIFFSRALDSGVDTFKITEGDNAARKAANRDAQCVGTLHRLDISGLHTLATILVDYLGTRLVCQSLVPGILHGEKTHKLLYGAVEATSPLVWDEEMQDLLEKNLGKGLMVATRTVPAFPLTDERLEEIKTMRLGSPEIVGNDVSSNEKKEESKENETLSICGPVEAKGILGSDQRKYLLDLSRLTPRDANWVPQTKGGTGLWESDSDEKPAKTQTLIPSSLEDDEWTMAILRPELITHLTHKKMREWMDVKKEVAKASSESPKSESTADDAEGNNQEEQSNDEKSKVEEAKSDSINEGTKKIDEEQKNNPEAQEYLKSLRMNVNVFLPHMKALKGVDNAADEQLKVDEEKCREAAAFLWNDIIPNLSKDIRNNLSHQIPPGGKSLTEFLHQRGINCRYLGRLANLAIEEENSDMEAGKKVASGKPEKLPRKVFPECWLELLECEMVARAAKHVLDSYFVENYGSATIQPAQLVSSFLSAIMMTSEESAAETERRLSNQSENSFDDEYFNSLTLFDVGGGGDGLESPVRDRSQVWSDIEREIGRRFRYTLTLYNRTESSRRVQYIPLLHRICQRCGLRLSAKNYALGGKGLCSVSSKSCGQITESYPIAPTDVVDILPMVKNAASIAGESFVSCISGAAAMVPSLHILLPDAKATFEAAHVHFNVGSLSQALEYVQEAANLYQRVVDTPLHINVSRCLDLTAIVLFQAQELELAATNASRALAITVQLNGFDCPEAIAAHSTMSHIHMTMGNLAEGMKHLRASIYLQEILVGKNSSELSNVYHKIGTIYHEFGGLINALRYYQEAASKRSYDRMAESMILKSMALLLANLGQFKAALDTEKRAYSIYRLTLGENHEITKNSANTLKHFMKLAVEQGNRQVQEERKRQEEQAADAIAHEIEADEVAEEEKKKKKKKAKKKKGKN